MSVQNKSFYGAKKLDKENFEFYSEETCSLNSTSISIDHSRDSILDFSICSNPIDEAAIMEEQLAANGVGHVTQVILHMLHATICALKTANCRELNDDVPSIAVTLSSHTSKDIGHSLTNRTIFTTATAAVASTTDSNNCQPVVSPPSSSSFLPFLFNAPPIASLEDLTNGEQNSDIATARSNAAAASTTRFGRNGVRESDLKETMIESRFSTSFFIKSPADHYRDPFTMMSSTDNVCPHLSTVRNTIHCHRSELLNSTENICFGNHPFSTQKFSVCLLSKYFFGSI
ncbi:unnamed protein product [Onchocerca flexuosa]|uniref:Uncharacterized protein n=1 Tax=Onchocerca flexuosa TaxID=387005 RepID=A0A183H0D9_9BILA|nr:unnamed protein product [Onchocerca flexuosa]